MSYREEQALLSLVQDSEGIAWASKLTGWSSDSGVPVCDWDGVTCRVSTTNSGSTSETVVSEVSLPAKGLSGSIPTELGQLTELEHLTLKNNILQGSIPKEIANLKKLVTLDFTECFLTGTLPQKFASTQLSTLLLANNAISGRFFETQDAPHLANIKEIRMENNLVTGTLSGSTIMKMPHLETLSVSANDLSGLIPGDELGSLPALRYLYVDTNHFVGPLPNQLAQVGRSQILELWVQDNALSGTVPASYVRFDKLHDFFIDGNKLTGALPPDLCGPEINSDFFQNVPPEAERNYCDSIACPAGSVAFEGVFPCERCPGGEAARLKNRYLGQTGQCSNYTQRDIMKIFHDATTKGGPWSGVSDWDDALKPVCEMTGVTCDAHGNVVEIALKGRRLEGHIPDEIGSLPFLESLDVSDNDLMGYVPSDLQWTSMRRLDVSGNKIRGIVPPLLCMMEELNGNGKDNVFYCDRIACPMGTYNSHGYHHGVDGEECKPCYDETPFIAQKACKNVRPPPVGFFEMAERTSEDMGINAGAAVGIAFGVIFGACALCCLMKCVRSKMNQQSKYNRNKYGSYHDESESDDDDEYDVEDNYSFNVPQNPRYHDKEYRDFVITDKDTPKDEESNIARQGMASPGAADYDDDNMSRRSTRSAVDMMSDHQGVALNRREKFTKSVSERLPGDLGQRARGAAAAINVSARRLSSSRNSVSSKSSRNSFSSRGGYEIARDGNGNGYDESYRSNMEMVPSNSSSGDSVGGASNMEKNGYDQNGMQHSDLLDVPMIT
eukprot:CAMPEP_0183705312 /NCGR_PEP_ID=MMETSP0737-20130205/2454_1 /TAXON_ID=385413 /ORGANISM="Thalassiosira miniscula, Strain CCMP1093" /LENGTH=780 /DNA_ID=CAMNT_0025932449 /DNA_START=137 /DNA_END=2479 /DNA_ORIENTATION=+